MPKQTKFKLTALILLIAIIVSSGIKSNKVAKATRTIIVPSPEYDTIQKAIYAAETGDIIQVSAGIYNENLIVNESVSIIGENPASTIINGSGNGDVVKIVRPNVVFSGFTIQNGVSEESPPPFSSGIFIGSSYAVISNNILKNNYCGLQLLQSSHCRIYLNTIFNNSYAGIYIHGDSSNNIFFENTIKDNKQYGLWIDSSPANIFYHNNIINNANQWLFLNSPTILDNGSEGNYWSDYHSRDLNLNGIGDIKYSTLGGYDNYPLMGVFTNFTILHGSETYFLPIISNSTISNFRFNSSQERIYFEVFGPIGTGGFCRIAVPNALAEDRCVISIDNRTPFNITWSDATYHYWSFAYEHTGTFQNVIIELEIEPPQNENLPSLNTILIGIILAATIAVLILSIVVFQRRKTRKQIKLIRKG